MLSRCTSSLSSAAWDAVYTLERLAECLPSVVDGVTSPRSSPGALPPWARTLRLLLACGVCWAALQSSSFSTASIGSAGGWPPPAGAPAVMHDGTRLWHFVVATRYEEGLSRLLRSAAWHGDAVSVVGRDDPRFQSWGVGFDAKVDLELDFLRSVGRDDLVLFTDAYDVLMLGSRAELYAGFQDAVARGGGTPDPAGAGRPVRVLFSTEAGCPREAPQCSDPKLSTVVHGPASTHHFPFLNSGAFIGYAGDLITLLSIRRMVSGEADGSLVTDAYLASRHNASLPRSALDHDGEVFLTSFLDPRMPHPDNLINDLSFSPVTRRWTHTQLTGTPTVLHTPGWEGFKQGGLMWAALQGVWAPQCWWWLSRPMAWPPCVLTELWFWVFVAATAGLLGGLICVALAVCGCQLGSAVGARCSDATSRVVETGWLGAGRAGAAARLASRAAAVRGWVDRVVPWGTAGVSSLVPA